MKVDAYGRPAKIAERHRVPIRGIKLGTDPSLLLRMTTYFSFAKLVSYGNHPKERSWPLTIPNGKARLLDEDL
jgi:hypothetical protein